VSCSAVLEVGCDDPGYVGTGMMVCGVAATLLAERWALDVEGGVFTPGALFYKSGLVGRLKKPWAALRGGEVQHPVVT